MSTMKVTEVPQSDSGPVQIKEPDLITKAVFAQRTSLSIRTVEKLLAERRIPAIRMTRKMVRIPWAEALEHLRKNYQVNAQ